MRFVLCPYHTPSFEVAIVGTRYYLIICPDYGDSQLGGAVGDYRTDATDRFVGFRVLDFTVAFARVS
jgi:hypothetical protein